LRIPSASITSSNVARREPHEFLETFGALSRCLRGAAAQAYAALGVGSAQAKILRHIGRNSRISQADLARATATAPTLTGRAIEPLVERGWVRRKRSEEDRREYILELTTAGQRVRERVEDERLRVAGRMVAALDEGDLDDFDRIAKKLLAEFAVPLQANGKPTRRRGRTQGG
jgi:DNA-binding MarR family transcriptional regulator